MNLETWFSVPIWFDMLDFDTEEVKNKCLEMKKNNFPNRVLSNAGGWQSRDINLHSFKEFTKLNDLIIEKIEEFSLSINPELDLILNNVWININEKGDSNIRHLHPSSVFSGVVYITGEEDSGDIVFHNDFHPWKYSPFNHKESILFYNQVTYKPQPRKILIFPSWLEHTVLESNSSQSRISISFNILQKQYLRD